MDATVLISALVGFALFVYLYLKRKWSYWSEKGVITPGFKSQLLSRFQKPVALMDQENCRKYGNIFGYYEGFRPVLIINDPDLIRSILVKDFHIFPNHRSFKTKSLFGLNLFNLKGSEEPWKRIRSIISPTFTSGKMRNMIGPIDDCIESLVENMTSCAASGEPVDVKKYFGAFTMDVICATAFGIKTDSVNNPDNPIVSFARQLFNRDITLKRLLFFMFPSVSRFLRLEAIDPAIPRFFGDLTVRIAKERKEVLAKGLKRVKQPDFIQLMLEANENKALSEEEAKEIASLTAYGHDEDKGQVNVNELNKEMKKTMSMEEIAGQGLIFFLAGYDTTATTLSYAAYLMATNPRVQDKVLAEVDSFGDEDLTYDSIHKLKYLDAVTWETLRLYPALGRLERESVAEYTVGDTGITLPPNSLVGIPIYSLQRDPKYFEDPEEFKPERFLGNNVNQGFGSSSNYGAAARHPYAFLPFGGGPRTCIGMRLAILEAHLCLAKVMKRFTFSASPDLKVEQYRGQLLLTQKNVMLRIIKRS